jgi:type I restriction enzyme, S subunit
MTRTNPRSQSSVSEIISLGRLVAQNRVRLWRGHVISKETMNSIPGPYPVYSSSVTNNGLLGSYGQYMFDEELITWSVDGGGNFFYRPKHKYSVTNVSGILKVLDDNILCKYLFYFLDNAHKKLAFDYVQKAHPSVISKLYNIGLPPIREQSTIAGILSTVDEAIEKSDVLISKLRRAKQGLLHNLLTYGIDEEGNIRSEKTHKFKNSPLGRIPEDWDDSPMPSLFEVIDNRGRTPPFADSGIPYVGADNIRNGRIDESSITRFVTASTFKKYMRGIPKGGDILFTTEAPLGEVAIIPTDYPLCFAQRVIALSPIEGRDSTFFYYALVSDMVRKQLKSLASGSTVQGISAKNMKRVLLSFPRSRKEQHGIATIVTQADRTIESEESYKAKLLALKGGLMEDLLTGEVSVNNCLKQ